LFLALVLAGRLAFGLVKVLVASLALRLPLIRRRGLIRVTPIRPTLILLTPVRLSRVSLVLVIESHGVDPYANT
jgi:hypothetical protein